MNNAGLILASGSEVRATILRNAGVDFKIMKSGTDEDRIKKQGLSQGKSLRNIALELAIAKASAVEPLMDEYVLGVDQILEFEGDLYDKPKSQAEAYNRFLLMRGKPHTLINAAVILQDGDVVWKNIEQPTLWFRNYSEAELSRYFDVCDSSILKSVGAYQVESYGIRLFDKVEGDYFAVLGLALNPLLEALRKFNLVDF